MRSFKLGIAALFVSVLAMPVLAGGVALAQPVPVLQCGQIQTIDDETFITNFTTENCDLGILKEVSVNGGAFVDANTSPDAAQAALGDSVVWRVTVTNPSVPDDGFIPVGDVLVADVLPSGVSFNSSTASEGSYDNTSNTWEFTMGLSTTFPIVLTINTTSTSIGLFENVASFDEYCFPSGDCNIEPYGDINPENNTDNAFVNIGGPPVVLGETTPVVLAATGSGVTESLVAAGLIVSTLGSLGYSRFARK